MRSERIVDVGQGITSALARVPAQAGPDRTPVGAVVPPAFAGRLRALTGRVTAEAMREIRRSVPAYRQPLEGRFGDVFTARVELAVRQAFEHLIDPTAPDARWRAEFHRAGRVEFQEGRTSDALQTAVRIGTRVAWRLLSVEGQHAGVPADTLFGIADALFVYVDELSAIAIEGYTDAQGEASGARERRRRQLLDLLLGSPAAAPSTVASFAATADWVVPDRVAVLALDRRAVPAVEGAPFGPESLLDLESDVPCVLLPDPDEATLAEVSRWLGGATPATRGVGALGPSVPAAEAGRSLAVARRVLELSGRGLLRGATPLVRSGEHFTELALTADEFLVDHIATTALAPFDALTERQRERLETTLLAWLDTRGGVAEIAARLDVHPQTVRYRMHQVEALLGDRLTDPDSRFTIEIALRSRRMREPSDKA
ncbi:helix-turn-helix domain-containing protein [Actinokineospora spheciospongiae]|uniref:PucR family transcriptional regulator n=1 Tax=Actinokineospora spheciospongiae TaxID=909613 RepID=UPI000D70EF26|nr:PucR family transcriptional regulator [Actinokineospora spheciospongiae]PWW52645.1 PucR-like helix-turn-helix protein [Actinokineospora spheciospongiae]